MPNQDYIPLWDVEHSHCYYGGRGDVEAFDSWQDLLDAASQTDPDLNHLYRWDWHKPGPGDGDPRHFLSLHFVMPRKETCFTADVLVTPDDEPHIRQWLTERARHITEIWAPIQIPTNETAKTINENPAK